MSAHCSAGAAAAATTVVSCLASGFASVSLHLDMVRSVHGMWHTCRSCQRSTATNADVDGPKTRHTELTWNTKPEQATKSRAEMRWECAVIVQRGRLSLRHHNDYDN